MKKKIARMKMKKMNKDREYYLNKNETETL